MNEDRLDRLVKAAVRGIMEAVLATEIDPPPMDPSPTLPQEHLPEQMTFPSVSRAEDDLFGEKMPKTNADLDQALQALAKLRERREQEARPDVQPGPGETEVDEWLRLPQT